jgi:hypothetical protein
MPVIGFKNSTATKRKYASDPATRAAELVSEGRFGGKQPGAGRPRKSASDSQQRASTVVADAARENADLIAATFVDTIRDPDSSRRAQMHASKTLIAIEGREAELTRADEPEGLAAPSGLPTDHSELVTHLATLVASNPIVARRLGALLASAAAPAEDPPNLG